MIPYVSLVERLFCEQLYTDMGLNRKTATASMLQILTANYQTILMGDAYMAPEELLDPSGAIYYYHNNNTPGIE
jgi:uncharacterized protein with von Willebrand factor type A (vWA) domain